MFAIERFIASAMSLVRMPPDAPTRAPAMISTGTSRTKPAIATAVPVNAFSSEMTTGMSAPPIGSTIVTPNASAAASRSSRAAPLPGSATSQTAADRESERRSRRSQPGAGGTRSAGRAPRPEACLRRRASR